MQIVESGDDCPEPRFSNGSMLCLVPPLTFIDGPKRSIYYNQLHQQPLKLTVLKLDGSSFGIEVEKMGTVRNLKQSVEAAFHHLPKNGPGRISWEHVWGQFCLCHEGQKLLNDHDYIGMIGIKDGDQLQFVHHVSNTHPFARVQPKTEDPDSDEKPKFEDGDWDIQQNSKKNDGHQIVTYNENQDDYVESEDGVIARCDLRITHLFRGWFTYHKLSSHRKTEGSSSSSRISHSMVRRFKNCLRFPSKKYS